MRVLLVDDEPPVVEGLERMLFAKAPDWEVEIATSGAEALELLEEDEFTAIVTDMRMPEMDGAELLREVHQDYPQVARVVLTGHTTLSAAMEAIPIAHQFLNKPCSPEKLVEVLDRACGLQKLITDPKLRAAVGNVNGLPPVPRVYEALSRAMANPEASASDLSRIVESDVAISAKVLHVANSAFFATAKSAESVQEAVVRLGQEALRALVLSAEVFQTFRVCNVAGFSVERFQQHSVMTSALCAQIVSDPGQRTKASLAGLMHDVGTLMLASHAPDLLEETLEQMKGGGESLWAAERRLRGVTHAELGAYLLGLWSLSPDVVQAIALHHEPPEDPCRRGLREALYLADIVAENTSPAVASNENDVVALMEAGAFTESELDQWKEAAGA